MRRYWSGIALMIMILLASPIYVEAEELSEQTQERIYEELDMDAVTESLNKLMPETKPDFTDTVTALIRGEVEEPGRLLIESVSDQLGYEFRYSRSTMIHILILSILAAVFTNFSNAFQNKQVSEIGFYVLYLMIFTLCLNSFRVVMDGAEEKIGYLLEFMRVLCPAYFMAAALSAGGNTAVLFYNIVIVLIYLVQLIVLNVIFPVIHIYIMMQILDNLTGEDYLTQFSELLQKGVGWALKTMLAGVIGMNVVQGLLTPAIDSLNRSVLTSTTRSIPGIGNLTGGALDVVLGTAVLIRNGIGTAGMFFAILICAVPLIQLVVTMILYKLIAAAVQPVSDKRIVGCISSISEGSELLLKTMFTTILLFLLTIGVVMASLS